MKRYDHIHQTEEQYQHELLFPVDALDYWKTQYSIQVSLRLEAEQKLAELREVSAQVAHGLRDAAHKLLNGGS